MVTTKVRYLPIYAITTLDSGYLQLAKKRAYRT